ncbi:extracellular solute-binding protein [Metabacillus dongyingensis]|uniref:extracellular solute-binding protein n=1 Tax=Metabacillus dongyingensis TaxID=2874282 RepID=UPI001CBC15B0|nr:extracellular solute-binding protein [Metabacillus dongyingensis]UAL53012.1 extracellular solute-binding protein [Metabacillus dongyingensis]
MKKLLLIMLAGLFVFAAGCSEKTETAEKNEDGSTAIRIVMKDENPSNPASVAYFEALEKGLKNDENLNVKFELVEMPQGNYAEKLNLLLLSGDIPDIIYFQGGDQQIADQDLLEDLTPHIEKTKYLKDSLEPWNEKRLENYPYLLWVKPLSQKTPVIRGDWFEKMKSSKALVADPTIDNYYNFFKELKTNPPGGAGKPAYAFTAAGDLEELNAIFNMSFGITSSWLNSGGQFEYYKVSNQEKEKLAFYQKLYKEGLLDPGYITKEWDTKEKAFYDGEAGVIVGTAGKVIDIYNGKMMQTNGENTGVKVLPPAKGEGQGFGAADVTKEARGVAISSQSEKKELAFKILDYLASPKGQMIDRLGFEGKHYEVTDGKIDLTNTYYEQWFARFWEPSEFKPEMPLKKPLLGKTAEESLNMVNEFYKEDNLFILPEEYIANWDAMENLYKEYATDIITGKRPLEDFDGFVKEWNAAGGKEITEYANKQLK